tara:strand:+ start:753 stop:1355 length:603 start_codon:yes stop_codon:yes gene_type:complete
MENVLNSGELNSLKMGQVLLTQVRKIGGGFMEMEIAEVKEGSRGLSPAFLFNKSDSRFSANSARRAWQNATPSDLEELLGIKVDDAQNWEINDRGFEVLVMNILNPVANYEGAEYVMRAQIQETITGDEYQVANVSKAAKRKGKEGPYILHQGNYIFTNASVVFTEPQDIYLTADTTSTTSNVVQEAGVEVDTLTGEIFN